MELLVFSLEHLTVTAAREHLSRPGQASHYQQPLSYFESRTPAVSLQTQCICFLNGTSQDTTSALHISPFPSQEACWSLAWKRLCHPSPGPNHPTSLPPVLVFPLRPLSSQKARSFDWTIFPLMPQSYPHLGKKKKKKSQYHLFIFYFIFSPSIIFFLSFL